MAAITLTAPFRIRPVPDVREGPCHYLLRLGKANSFSAHWIWRRVGASRTELVNYLQREIHADAFAYLAQDTKSIWITRYARVCPRCLQGNVGSDSMGWEIRSADACIHHKCWLVDQCRCGARLNPLRARLNQCNCGVRLSSFETREAPPSVVTLSAMLISSLSMKSPMCLNSLLSTENPFRQFNTSELQVLIRVFGFYGDPNSPLRASGEERSFHMSESWPVTSLAAEVIINWPEAFHRLLAWNQSRNENDSTLRLSRSFGRLYHHLYVTLRDPRYDFIRTELEHYLTTHWPAVSGGNRLRMRHIEKDRWRWWPANKACAALGVSKAVLFDLVARGELEIDRRVTAKDRERAFVRGARLNGDATSFSESFMTCNAAAAELGIHKARLRAIVATIIPDAWKGADNVWRIPTQSVKELVLIGSRVPWISDTQKKLITLGHALQFLNLSSAELAQIICRAREDVRCCPIGRQGRYRALSSWAFERAYIDSVRNDQSKSKKNVDPCSISVRQLADRWSITRKEVYKLLHTNALSVVSGPRGPRAERTIAVDEIERFEKRYIFATDISKRLRWSCRMVIPALITSGIPVAFGGNGIARTIFERTTKLERAVLSINKALAARGYRQRHRKQRNRSRQSSQGRRTKPDCRGDIVKTKKNSDAMGYREVACVRHGLSGRASTMDCLLTQPDEVLHAAEQQLLHYEN